MQSLAHNCISRLLPPSAQSNLKLLLSTSWVQAALPFSELAANLDQNPDFQEHCGKVMPTILASISHMCLDLDQTCLYWFYINIGQSRLQVVQSWQRHFLTIFLQVFYWHLSTIFGLITYTYTVYRPNILPRGGPWKHNGHTFLRTDRHGTGSSLIKDALSLNTQTSTRTRTLKNEKSLSNFQIQIQLALWILRFGSLGDEVEVVFLILIFVSSCQSQFPFFMPV